MKEKITRKWIKENTKSLRAVASILKIKTEILQYQIDSGRLELFEGRIKNEDVERIQRQREAYLNLREYMMMHENERFIARNGAHRNKYIDFLEENAKFVKNLDI